MGRGHNSIIQREIEILNAATKIFAKKDYHQVTMDEIAQDIKVGKGTLYRYYHSKKELYFSIIDRGLEALYNYIKKEVEGEKDILLKVKKLIFCGLRFFEKNRPFVKLFFQEEVKFQEKGMIQCRRTLDKSIKLTEQLIWEAQLDGKLRIVDTSFCASLLIGGMKQVFLKSVEENMEIKPEEISELIYQAFLYGFQAQNKKT